MRFSACETPAAAGGLAENSRIGTPACHENVTIQHVLNQYFGGY
jgi:hypothetical protein